MSGGQTERQVQLIRDFAPDIIMVTPSYMLAILDEFKRQGIDPRSTIAASIGIFGAEPWGEGMRAEIESAFNHRCLRHLRPVGGDGSGRRAGICSRQGWADDLGGSLLPEIVDPGTGERLADGRGKANWCSRR